MNILKRNEINVNKQMLKVLWMIVGAFPIYLATVLYFGGNSLFQIAAVGVVALLGALIPTLYNRFSNEKRYVKYMIVISCSITMLVIYANIFATLMLMLVVPILIGCMYFNRKLIVLGTCLAFSNYILGEYIASFSRMGFIANLDYFGLHIIAGAVEFSCIGYVVWVTAKRAEKMIDYIKKSESELLNNKILFETITDNMPMALYAKDTSDDYKYLLINDFSCKFINLEKDECIGYNDFDLFSEAEAERLLISDKRLYEETRVEEFDEELESRNGHKVLHVNRFMAKLPDGRDILVGMFWDVTIDRDREEDFKIARIAADESNLAQSRFVANMSHEIRTPLNAILGYSEIMKNQNKDRKMDHYLMSINTAGNALLSLVNDILDFSKVKANKFKTSYSPANISNFCEELKVLFYHRVTQKNIDLELNYPTDTPTFMLPIATIRQIMINIVGNAIKFTNEGGVYLNAQVRDNKNASYDIDISVRDTGIGINSEKFESIFEEFEQVDISHQKTGTGLGLALSMNFAKLIGAEISVESEEGVGSIFTLHMENIKMASDEVQAISNSEDESKIEFCRQKVLILDDIEDNREVLKAHCKHINLEAKTYDSGSAALADVTTYKPELILTDLRMPSMNGESFAKNIRAIEEFKDIPILCITASINPDENYHLDDFNEVLNKPISSDKLSKAISKYLRFNRLVNKNEIGVFNLKNEFNSLRLEDDNFDHIKKMYYEDIKRLGVAMNPKKQLTIFKEIKEYAESKNLDGLGKICDYTIECVEKLDVVNMLSASKLFAIYLEK